MHEGSAAAAAAVVHLAVDYRVRYSAPTVLMTACKEAAVSDDACGEEGRRVQHLLGGVAPGTGRGAAGLRCAHAFHRRCISKRFRKKADVHPVRGERDPAPGPGAAEASRRVSATTMIRIHPVRSIRQETPLRRLHPISCYMNSTRRYQELKPQAAAPEKKDYLTPQKKRN
jgi:hypothetical protein